MFTRILVWFYIHFIIPHIKLEGVERKVKPDTLVLFEEIQHKLFILPTTVKAIDKRSQVLLKSFTTRFRGVGHIFESFTVYCDALGEQLNDPIISKPIPNEHIRLGSIAPKPIMLAYFQVWEGVDYSVGDTVNKITTELDKLILFYTQVVNHEIIDDDYVPYVERMMGMFATELLTYVEMLGSLE